MRSARLGFGEWCRQDIELAFELWGDRRVTALIAARGVLSRDEIADKLDDEIALAEQHSVQYWPIFRLDDHRHVGCSGLRPYDLHNGVYEIGFHIRPRYWRRGYAFEAAETVIVHAFQRLEALALFAGHNPENQASKALLLKLGFRFTHDEYYPPTGLDHPSYLLRVGSHDVTVS